MTDVVVDRLRIRGGGARRLAAVAARTLPAALEDALGDLADGVLGPLTVTLDVDPDDYDDDTLAVLWADRVRAAALAAGAARRAAGPDAGGSAGAGRSRAAADGSAGTGGAAAGGLPGGTAEMTADDVAALVRAWLDAGAPVRAVPVALASASDPALAAALVAALGADGVGRLAAALGSRPGTADAVGRPPLGGPGQRDVTAGGPTGAAPAPDDRSALPRHRTAARPAADPARRLAAASDAVRPYLELTAADAGRAASADLTGATVVGGVVLCYPWLADLCRAAVEEHAAAAPTHARRLALAVLCGGPDPDPALLDDPLVRFLAGATPAPSDADPPAAQLAPLDTAALARAADDVLARFAALLRGFERSTPGFVRDQWVIRPGLLDLDRDPPRLLAATAPLDVVLGWLPYPVALLRLPWTPPLTVRMRP